MDKFLNWLTETGALKLLKSKRFWVSLIGFLAMNFLDLSPEQIEAIVVVVGMLVGGYSLQDAAAAYKK